MTRQMRMLVDALVLVAAIVIVASRWMRPQEEAASRSAPTRRPPTLYRRANT